MTPQDFRIGNLLESLTWGGAHQIEGIEIVEGGFNIKVKGYTHEYRDGEYFEFETIQLTQEWLERFGFEKLDKYTWVKNGFFVHHIKEGFVFIVGRRKIKLSFVHTLQNTYFCIEQNELY